MSVYVVSDLHGRYDLFRRGLEMISLSDGDMLYAVGDMIDRNPGGISILQDLKSHDNMDLLIGNHEFMMLNAVSLTGEERCNGRDAHLWLYGNGGEVTEKEYRKLSLTERKSLLEWLQHRPVIKPITTFHCELEIISDNRKRNGVLSYTLLLRSGL